MKLGKIKYWRGDEIAILYYKEDNGMDCPVCRKKVNYKSWYEDYGQLVEVIYKCKCENFKYHWSYGLLDLKIGKWEASFHSHNHLDNEAKEIEQKLLKDFHLRVRYYKRKKTR